MKRLALAVALLPSVGFAQLQTTRTAQLPVFVQPSVNRIPFGEPKIHYQQLYQGSQLGGITQDPVRIIGLQFLDGVPAGTVYDIEVTLAHASTSLNGVFASNFIDNPVVVIPRRMVTPTGPTIDLPFVNEWVYDGSSNVVVDLKIFGTATNQPFNHNGRATISRVSNTARQFFIGDANATVANSSGATYHYGLVTRFLYQTGGVYEYGSGCPGGMNIVPVGSANAVPLPGLKTYTQLLANAGSGYPAAFILGISRTTWNGSNLPLNLGMMGAGNCSLNAAANLIVFTTTVGGGPGAGNARLPTPIPAIGALAGVKVYSQWVVFDLAAANGTMATTTGLMHVVGS